MTNTETEATSKDSGFEPPFPTVIATTCFTFWIFLLSLPMWTGKFLAGANSDQLHTGFAFRAWAAQQWRTTGKVPLWNPEIFGGMPFVAGMHGDIFYPTAWLRLILPTHVAMNIGFVVHYVLAGLFAYLLFRRLKLSWAGAVTGGLAYQLTGVVASYVSPGHDGKLFVTALFPLALLGLVMALRDKKIGGYFVVALAVGLGFLSPHPQMLYYMLVASGLFALYLTFGKHGLASWKRSLAELAGAMGSVFLGFGIGAIQMIPFYFYIPFSPRAETYGGWDRATSFAIPWSHVPEFFFSMFTGSSNTGTYWAHNGFKLHSEYIGLAVVALAVLGIAGQGHRKLKIWMGAIAGLFLLISLGAGTPFYALWYNVMPFMKQVRAPGMALYIVALVVAMFAGLGVMRLEAKEGERHVKAWLWIAGFAGAFALLGVFGNVASNLAISAQARFQQPMVQVAESAAGSIRNGALMSAIALGLTAVTLLLAFKAKIQMRIAVLIVLAVLSADLWWNARPFWIFSIPERSIFVGDSITDRLEAQDKPLRVFELAVYPPGARGSSGLMEYDIPQLLGHHGNELHAFDEAMGGRNRWRFVPFFPEFIAPDAKIFDLFAVNHLILPAGAVDAFPGFTPVLQGVQTAGGGSADLFDRDEPIPYARMVPAALPVPDSIIPITVIDPRFDPARIVLLDSTYKDPLPPLTELPEPLDVEAVVDDWAPGRMHITLDEPAPVDGFVVVAENWYFDWRATVDGEPVTPVRGNGSLLTVPVNAGAKEISLWFESEHYKMGKVISVLATIITILGIAVPQFLRKRVTVG